VLLVAAAACVDCNAVVGNESATFSPPADAASTPAPDGSTPASDGSTPVDSSFEDSPPIGSTGGQGDQLDFDGALADDGG
jgi:hypothetical protein